jgi:hypothetical protein
MSPKTAGYYGLELPEAVEREIETLNNPALMLFIADIANFLFRYSHRRPDDRPSFLSHALTKSSDEYLGALTESSDEYLDTLDTKQFVSLMKWLCDRLESLYPTN